MKRVVVCVLLTGMLSGCSSRSLLPYAQEMGEAALIRAVGVDVVDDGVELTVATGCHGEEEAVVLSAQGRTLPEAALAAQSLGWSYVYCGYADQLVIGEEWAMAGLAGLMDWLAREAEIGLGMRLWVVREATAGQVIRSGGVRGAAEWLSQLDTDGERGAANIGCTAARLMSVLARDGSTYLPALAVVQRREGDGGEGEEGTLLPVGYGVVRKGKLVCWTDEDTAQGVELMEGRAFGRVVHLALDDASAVGLQLENVRTQVGPVFRDGVLTGVDVRCDVSARIAQAQRRVKQGDMVRMRDNLERLVGERIIRALELGQYWDADYLDLKRRIQMARPEKKMEIEDWWESVYRSLEIRVDVRGEIERSFGM